MAASEEERASSNVLNFDDTVVPLVKASVADRAETDHRVSDAIRLVPTPGHTPGHVSVSITSQSASALITGDCAHPPAQLAAPYCYSLADADPHTGTAHRHRLSRAAADTHLRLYV